MKIKKLDIATWNINSVRLRMPIVKKFLKQYSPDVLCLQEIKCQTDLFPYAEFEKLGYKYMAVEGQKGYHGVAIVSLHPIKDIESINFCNKGDKRHVKVVLETKLGDIGIHNFYVPAGGDIPDTKLNDKFGHKLDFLNEMKRLKAVKKKNKVAIPHLLVGDLNIAPLEEDVWSHKQLLKVVSHTPIEVENLLEVMKKGGWQDAIRTHIPVPKLVFTWWSYRSSDWKAANKGRRLDHIWGDSSLIEKLKNIDIIVKARGWTKPSDHVPILAQFEF